MKHVTEVVYYLFFLHLQRSELKKSIFVVSHSERSGKGRRADKIDKRHGSRRVIVSGGCFHTSCAQVVASPSFE